MPRLPDVTSFGQRQEFAPSGRIVSYRPSSDKETLPGQALVGVAEVLDRESERINTIRAEDAFNQLRQKQLELTSGADGFVQKKSGDAVNQPLLKTYSERFANFSKEIEGSLSGDRQKDLFRKRANISSIQFQQDMLNHITHQTDIYAKEVFKSSIDVETRNAIERRNDPNGIALSMERANATISSEANRSGWPSSMLNDSKKDVISGIHTGIVSQFIADDNLPKAKSYFVANKDSIDTKQQLHIESMFRQRSSEQSSEMRVQIQDRMQDIEAMGRKGVTPPSGFITDQDIATAFPDNQTKTDQMKRRRDEAIRFAGVSSLLHGKGNQELVDLVNKDVPSGRAENFAEEAKHHDELRMMAANIYKERITSPIEYAAQHNIGAPLGGQAVNPLNTADPQAFSDELVNRQRVAKIMNDRFQSPIQLLTKQEASGLAQVLKSGTAEQKKGYLGKISTSLGDDFTSYKAVMGQIAPDDPVTAIAGVYQARGRSQASDLMLRGQDILRPSRKEDGTPDKGKLWPMPPENDMRRDFASYERDAYAGQPKARSDFYQSALSIYAAKSADEGDGSGEINTKRWEESIRLATGGIEKWNGKATVMPYGKTKGEFKDDLYRHIDVLADSTNVTPAKLRDMPLEAVGDGKYVFRSGDSILVGKDKKPVVVDFNKPLPPTKHIPFEPKLGFYFAQ